MRVFREDNRVNEATGRLVGAIQKSSRALVDGAAAIQEQNIKLFLNWTGGPVETFRDQAETNRRAMQILAEQSQKQWQALWILAEESVKAYMGLLYAPVPSRGPGPFSADGHEAGKDAQELPIEDYDRLSVEEISRRLDELDALEIEELRAYEQRHKNRRTLLEQLDRALV